jgi:flavin reductase (DIM6/NTAB) family NADH-FMN oxidoreductase RutF
MTTLGTARSVTKERFRDVLGRFASGVGVVTTAGAGGSRAELGGMTATAFTSLSLDPPMVLVCVRRAATILPKVLAAQAFAVTVLGEDQRDLSALFAASDPTALDRCGWRPSPVTGSPILDDGVLYVDCTVADIHPGGDHVILVGLVRDLDAGRGGAPPLLWFRGGYHRIERAMRP